MRPRYLGPLIVISHNKGGVYIIAELHGSLFDRPVAAFCLTPYFACTKLELPSLDKLLDVSIAHLRKLEDTSFTETDDFFENEDPEADTLADGEDD
jgi:hypothetical protein